LVLVHDSGQNSQLTIGVGLAIRLIIARDILKNFLRSGQDGGPET